MTRTGTGSPGGRVDGVDRERGERRVHRALKHRHQVRLPLISTRGRVQIGSGLDCTCSITQRANCWEYDLRTGRSWCEPHRARVRNFPVAIEPGRTLVERTYVAETFPIRVEDDYVVIDTQPPVTAASPDRTA